MAYVKTFHDQAIATDGQVVVSNGDTPYGKFIGIRMTAVGKTEEVYGIFMLNMKEARALVAMVDALVVDDEPEPEVARVH